MCLQSAGELERRAWNHCPSRHHSGCQHPEYGVVGEHRERAGGGADRERFPLAQAEQSGDLVNLAAGENDRLDRASARTGARMQLMVRRSW